MTKPADDVRLVGGLVVASLALALAVGIELEPSDAAPLAPTFEESSVAHEDVVLVDLESSGRESVSLSEIPLSDELPDRVGGVDLARIDAVLAELEAALELPLDRPAWETSVTALAAALDTSCEPAVLALACDAERGPNARIAATEILRAFHAEHEPPALALPEASLTVLREALEKSPSPALRSAAASSLSAFGFDSDLRHLADTLAFSSNEDARGNAAWGLRFGGQSAARELARVLDLEPDALATNLALGVLESRTKLAPALEADPALTAACARIARDGERDPSLRKRALLVLGAQGDSEAREVLVAVSRDADAPPEILRCAALALAARSEPDSLVELELSVGDPARPLQQRIAAAEALLRRDPDGTSVAKDLLVDASARAPEAAMRLRAERCLAALR